MDDLMIKIDNVSKMYKLGQIGGTTLRDELQRKFARLKGKEDPTKRIGTKDHKKNETFMALNGVSFEVKKGECIGIIGHNGAGKSTLLKLLARVTAPTSGEIYLNGRVASMLEVGTGFHPELTGRENIYMNGAILGMTKAEIDKKIEEIIEFSECRQFIDTPVKRYSSGMYVKLAFSVAAHLDSEIMIMDEVLAVGDVKFQKKCLGKMGDEANNEGKTILYVSHNMSTIRQLCNRCVVLDHGKVIFEGDVEKAISIYENSTFEDLRKFYDFRDVARPPYGHGEQIFIDSFEFDDREKPIYHNLEKVMFTLNFHSLVDVDNLNLYFTIKAADGTVVGTTQSKWNKNVTANEHYTDNFELDTSNLAEGFYHFQIDLFSYGVGGVFHSYDRPLKDVTFSIIDADYKGINWNSKNFGYVRLQPIEYKNGH